MLEASDNMVAYKRLQREPASRDLFNNRITTLQGLQNALKDSAFLAIDTEHVAIHSEKDRVLHQVGLAYLPTLAQQGSPRTQNTSAISTRWQRLQEFYTENQIQGLTLNINMGKEKHDLVRVGGWRGMPARRSHRFGQEQHVDVEDLEAAIVDFIQSRSSGTNLVMIGFAMAAEWKYLFTVFPRAIPFFSAWMDVGDITKDISSSVGVNDTPGLKSLLQIYGYHWKDLRPARRDLNAGFADNAGDDAVATCVLANALLSSENQKKLKFEQKCRQISKRGGYRDLGMGDVFTVIISAKPGPLPSMIDSPIKLARWSFAYSPWATGVMSKDEAFVVFESQDEMDQFISADEVALPTGEVLSVECFSRESEVVEREEKERREKQELRERKRLERAGIDVEDLGDLFC